MNPDNLIKTFGECELEGNKIIVKSDIRNIISYVKENFSYDILKEIIAIHKPDRKVELVYHLYSTADEEDLFVSVSVSKEAETVADIFQSAIADENEIYDLFGIQFNGNNHLKRLYMPEGWQGFPLRKDYIQDDTRLCWNDDNNS